MSSADLPGAIVACATWLRTRPRRYGFAVVLVAVATLARYALGLMFGPLPPFVVFLSAIILVALLAGFGPGTLATLLSAASVASFFWPSLGVFGSSRPREIVGLLLFCGIGTGISGLGRLYRLHESRLLEFERVVEGLEEMIVVIDRNYRYRIANRAFLQYRNMIPKAVIGHHLTEILNPTVFEKVIKEKWDECFHGTVVRYEMSYVYPDCGERQLLIQYSPIYGPGGIDRAACVIRDVTNRKQAEHSLELFRTLIDQSNDAV